MTFLAVAGLWILLTEWLAPGYHVAAHVVAVLVTAGLIGWIVARAWRQRIELEQKYQQIQRLEAIGRLAGGIAHDLNNLLTVIGGYTDLMLQDLPEDDPHRQDLEQVMAASDRARSMNKQILAFSRRQPVEMTSVDVNDLVASTVELARRAMAGVDLKVDLAEGLGPIRADPGQIEQVLMNLLINARDAVEAGGEIRVETSEEPVADSERRLTPVPMDPDIYARIRVRDTGHGMDEETLRQVFEPFYSTKQEGTGLGLATCYGIAKRHGGYIWASSEPGEGTTFDVYLPMTQEVEETVDDR